MGRRKKAHNGKEVAAANGNILSSYPTSSSSNKQVTFDNASKPCGDYYIPPSGRGLISSPSQNTLNRIERQKIVLWRRPFQTTYYFIRELLHFISEALYHLWCNKWKVLLTVLLTCLVVCVYHMPGAHQAYVNRLEKRFFSCVYWIGLGILSSVGLGTGLHTFILYLGPHIASVTMAAYECNSLDFPEPPYPDRIICPDEDGVMVKAAISMWAIMSKVRLESLMWGAGTALGELPPYFMAKAARISGEEPDSEEYREFLAYIGGDRPREPTIADRFRQWTEKLVTKVGFLGILVFASVPNPFFDLAGITCGHFLVPFSTFFGATLIGKALVKTHIQVNQNNY
ncbi:hypothetical protein AB6A40_002959 [Gnathostoma spinigerum]|uniref:Vacuole membrane protein 1 n=1 Tax=Gnathostoma spinigerum TaxID=75299 RepID=A0ABD6E838_9BILA